MKLKIEKAAGLRGKITVPGDKSISHRAVMLAALADGPSRIKDWLPAGDCWATVQAMRDLGVKIDVISESETHAELVVHGVGLNGLRTPSKPIDCQGSGTTMRLLAGILAGQPLAVTLDGHNGLRRRPMERVARPLRQMGAEIETTDGRPPLRIRGGRLRAIDYQMPIASGQVKSAILLAGVFAEGGAVVHQPGPARDHTERMLNARAVTVETDGATIRLAPDVRRITPLDISVPADFSSAAFPLVAALLVPESDLTIERVNINHTRTGLLDVLLAMDARIEVQNRVEEGGEPLADLLVRSSDLSGTEIEGETVVRMIDEFPILAVAATQARGRTIVRDAAELRVKETDRIEATVDELRKLGAQMIPHPAGFEVHGPTPLKGADVDANGDHRLAMALVVAGLIAEGATIVHGAEVIADSYPGFVSTLKSLGVSLE